MEILSSTPEQVEVRLTFEKPWKATNHVAFELNPSGDAATDVTWRMTGRTTGVAAVFSKVVSMDRVVGKDFERGLERAWPRRQSSSASSTSCASFRHPVVVGGGTPFLPPVTDDIALDLIETRTFGSRVIFERYRRARDRSE